MVEFSSCLPYHVFTLQLLILLVLVREREYIGGGIHKTRFKILVQENPASEHATDWF